MMHGYLKNRQCVVSYPILNILSYSKHFMCKICVPVIFMAYFSYIHAVSGNHISGLLATTPE